MQIDVAAHASTPELTQVRVDRQDQLLDFPSPRPRHGPVRGHTLHRGDPVIELRIPFFASPETTAQPVPAARGSCRRLLRPPEPRYQPDTGTRPVRRFVCAFAPLRPRVLPGQGESVGAPEGAVEGVGRCGARSRGGRADEVVREIRASALVAVERSGYGRTIKERKLLRVEQAPQRLDDFRLRYLVDGIQHPFQLA